MHIILGLYALNGIQTSLSQREDFSHLGERSIQCIVNTVNAVTIINCASVINGYSF
jgi:hypothetical protein